MGNNFKICPVCNPPQPAPHSPPQQQPNYNPNPPQQPNYNPNPPQQPNYNPNPPQQPNYNPNPQNYAGYKTESTTLILAIVLGIIGLPGIGHMYVGKVGKGVGILIGGMVLLGIGIVTMGIGIIVYLILFIWQIFNSRNLCRQYNQYLSQNGRPPW